jgi:putative transposase
MILEVQEKTGGSLRQICRTLQLSRSSFYCAEKLTATQTADQEIGKKVEKIFHHHQKRYGYRRIREDLQEQKVVCAPCRVRRIMRERGLHARTPKHFVPRTSDGRADKPSPNLLLDQPLPKRTNEVWAGDITFIPTASGWLYLAVVIDLCSRKIVGWSLSNHLRSTLVVEALQQALGSRPKTKSTVFHSDRGSQYGSAAYRSLLAKAHMKQSMSARANPYHNAWTESFIGTLKKEMRLDGPLENDAHARTEIFEYIEIYYNNQRRHSSLNYLTPARFENQIAILN